MTNETVRNRQRALDLLVDLIRIPSPSGEEAAVAAFLADWLRANGLPAKLEGRNVHSSLGAIDAAVVGEPTGLAPVIAQKGLLALEAVVSGKQAHVARPEEGENAIERAAEAILGLRALRFERIHPVLGAPTAVPTVIKGGDRRNTIPARVELSIDVRTTPSYEPA